MPLNRNALIRYRTIDQCLQNRYRKWTLDNLMDACSEALYEFQGIEKGVSRRTVQADLEMMRSSKLGYEAPIIVVDRKYYTYADKNFSITNIPLNAQDMQVLSEVAGLLQQFKGFHHFVDLREMVSKLEDKIYTQQTSSSPVVDFEKNDHLVGLNYIETIRKAIVNKTTLCMTYQSFRARQPATFCFSAFLLKEYRNRWFVLGQSHQKQKPILTLALDRIQNLEEDKKETYRENDSLDLKTFYSDVVGVTKTPGQKSCEVVFWVDPTNAPYVITKPIHASQELISRDKTGSIFRIKVVLNFELERELLGFGGKLKVIRPRLLRSRMIKCVQSALANYENPLAESNEDE
ncbi:WYL domain-containing protein [Siphonobacter sp. SORGH_AS_0500]|uniref:helix-turn-helix transcriptional regulator n=1 Tax=Siphonobacter sp. SORGH_AS_0500 TaxID=1864824 RepID=UPI000CB28F05|nr:WYL domain-containing protein [Siphonobacter sp. SORGH_AS_0500]PKK37370.1 WYL domain-containing protein [Siphonobacter sp. SORGH_AS_0500]